MLTRKEMVVALKATRSGAPGERHCIQGWEDTQPGGKAGELRLEVSSESHTASEP